MSWINIICREYSWRRSSRLFRWNNSINCISGTATEFTIPTLTVTETSNLGGTTNITGNMYQIIGDTKNTQYGYQALTNSSNGTLNTAIGYESMAVNTAGNYNTSVGDYSLATNSSGNYNNTSIGHFSSIYNTT